MPPSPVAGLRCITPAEGDLVVAGLLVVALPAPVGVLQFADEVLRRANSVEPLVVPRTPLLRERLPFDFLMACAQGEKVQ